HDASTGHHDPNDGRDAPSVRVPPAPNGGAPNTPDSSCAHSSEEPPSSRPRRADAPSSRRARRSEDQPDTNIPPPMRSRVLGTVGARKRPPAAEAACRNSQGCQRLYRWKRASRQAATLTRASLLKVLYFS